jgi:hypothetical protein
MTSGPDTPGGSGPELVLPKIIFCPMLTCGFTGTNEAGDVCILIDSEQDEREQTVTLYHEALHLLGLVDEEQVEAMAQRLAKACPELLAAVRKAHGY